MINKFIETSVVCKRQHMLFNKFQINLSWSVNTDNTVGQPSRANADPITDPLNNKYWKNALRNFDFKENIWDIKYML
ncbi:hypothetical protein BCR32DRAFT_278346 [Anaeromyces robustus]|uniref:Uncharacterized protein n=1 Tax=Anaeromyces robustus TaxID=1754192 RepID=A0A1Y1XBK5_9FUNG|nr:hypothetical protein BCR32DRAFT_278346 [Anaeromyces robustus]|eukprot:ORX83117.1 hypothetical protein BCR32DRAFT_278346 [Anaeromyces robustus]